MKISVLEIFYRNIRDIQPELTVSFSKEGDIHSNYCISILQMPNGTGKTTTMELLNLAFNGTTDSLPESQVKEYKPHKKEVNDGEFRVKISVDNKIRYIQLKLDYIHGTITCYTIQSAKVNGGKRKGLQLDGQLRLMFTEKFVKLFIFDGEYASDLLDNNKTSAKEAIRSLYHLDTLEKLAGEDIEKLIQEKQEEQESSVKSNQGLQNIISRRDTFYNTRMELQKELKTKTKMKGEIEKELKSIQSFVEKKTEEHQNLREKNAVLKEKKQNIQLQLETNTPSLLNLMRSPHNVSNGFNENLSGLIDQMTFLKLPKTTSQEFFKELSSCDTCICGRVISSKESKAIIENSKKFLSENEIGILNSIKSKIRELPEPRGISIELQNGKRILEDESLLNQERDRLDKELKESGFNEIEKYRERETTLKIELQNTELIINSINETDSRQQKGLGLGPKDNIPLCEKELRKWERQIEEATQTKEFVENAGFFKDIIRDIIDLSENKYRDHLKEKTNEKILQILGNDGILVSKISDGLTIESKAKVSEGQTLTVAYSFISSLLGESQHELPFIVDTPAAPLDLKNRSKIAEVIPKLFDQIIVFITSSERQNFADRFYSKKDECQFMTIVKHPGDVGILLNNDLDYFTTFQSEEE